jgi:hypothetical protein
MRAPNGSAATGGARRSVFPNLNVYEMAERNDNPMQREDSDESLSGKTKSGEQ